jgi:glycosyltransferase involved in cell wall biosynthesis
MAHADLSGDIGERRAAEAMQKLETRIWRDADSVLYLSDEEAAGVRALEPSVDVRSVIPYAFTLPSAGIARDDRPGEPLVLFVAGFGHPPNADAAAWFVREVLPSVLISVPAAHLAIVGSNPSPPVQALCGPRVSLFANVSDAELLAWYRRSRVAVVPLQTGGGVKLKSVEPLWHGVPVVLTPSGAQGLPGVDRVASVETQPDAFARAVIALLTDDALWRRRRVAGAGYARARFTEAAQRQSLLLALDQVAPPSVCRRVA